MASELARYLRDVAWSEVAGLGLVADPTITEIDEAVKGAVATVLRELGSPTMENKWAARFGTRMIRAEDLRTLADEIERDE